LREHLTPWRAAGAIVLVLFAAFLILAYVPSGTFPHSKNEYILLPDIAHPVAPLVRVQGAHKASGSGAIYFLDVIERRATTLEQLFPWIHPNATFEPAGDVVPPCSSSQQANQAQLQAMAFSQRVAAAVALRRLGYHVVVRPTGVVVSQLIAGTNAPCKLEPMDVIVAVDGTPTPTIASLHGVLGRVRPGAVVSLRVRRGGHIKTVLIRTVGIQDDPGRAFVGFAPDQSATFKLPFRVSIDAQGVGGPSAGLAFALEVMQKLGRDVTHGYRVAATGEMELNGAVAPIGGVRQKVVDASKADVDVLLVPVGENAQTARHYAKHLRVIAVRSFGQALHALATLPRKR
jgi:PDZ domain-containing protein